MGDGLKTYMSAGQVVVLAFVVPFYGKLVANRPRMRLINMVTAFFTACLVVFYFLAQAGVPLAIPYFIWIGIFNLMIVAQFWSFANVIYDEGRKASGCSRSSGSAPRSARWSGRGSRTG